MRKRNTLSTVEFIIEHVWVNLLISLFYDQLLFKSLPNLSYTESKVIFWVIIFTFSIAGIALCFKQYRTDKTVIINLLIAYEVYSVLAYAKYFPTLIIVGAIITLLCLLYFYWTTFTRSFNRGANKTKMIHKRIRHALLGSRLIIVYCFFLLFLPFTVKTIFGFSVFDSTVSATSASFSSASEENTLANNIETLSQLDEDIWATLTLQEKLDVMQVVANVEANYLGLNHELNVIALSLEDSVCGYYDDSTHHIVFNLSHLEEDDSYECLDTLCHEAYHAYQHRQVDVYNQLDTESQNLLMFYEVSFYKEEFEGSYVSGSDSWWDYYTQYCEIYARSYAADNVETYYEAIQAYLSATAFHTMIS